MLNVVHAFTGVDAQYMAEKKVWGEENINVLGSMEIDVDAIISCALIHENEKFHKYMKQEWDEEQYNQAREWLRKRNIGYDFSKEKSKLDKMRKDKLKQLYIASVCIRNYGDISLANKVKLKDEIDLFTYSFPCTDISLAGKQEGLAKGSGTRSGLLWECEQFISNNKPKVLLMENVKNLVSKKFINEFSSWIEVLKSLGYKSYWKILNSKDYGVPQNRERVFMISVREDINKIYTFPSSLNVNIYLGDILEDKVENNYYLSSDVIGKIYNWKAYERPLEKVLGKSSIVKTLTARGAGEYHSGMILICDAFINTTNIEVSLKKDENNLINMNKKIRRLTPRECWRLMGFSDSDFDKVQGYISDTQLYKQAGNSIVVNCLEAIFKELKNQGILEG